MCGYCTESTQLMNLEKEALGKRIYELDSVLIAGPYLQESSNLFAAMEKIKSAAWRRKVAPLQAIPSEVLVCRAIDVLLEEGFDSVTYQKLLNSKTFLRVVETACSSEKYAALESLPPEFRLTNLSCLYQKEFFYYPAYSQSLKKFKIFDLIKHECLDLLRAYIRGNLRRWTEQP